MPKLTFLAPLLLAIGGPVFGYTPAMENQAHAPDKTAATAILQAVCGSGGQVQDAPQSTGAARMFCSPCPDFTSMHGLTTQQFNLRFVLEGSFTAPGSQDLAAFFEGCEPLSDNFGGAVLLNRNGDGWKMARFVSSLRPLAVRTVRLATGRDLILAEGNRIGLGLDNNSLYTFDFAQEFNWQRTILMVSDTTRACGNDLTKASLDKVSWQGQNFSATVTWGRIKAGADYLKDCPDKIPAVATQSYTLNFTFDGTTFHPAADSVATLAQINQK